MCGEWLQAPGGTGTWRFVSLSTWVNEHGQCASVVVTQMPGLWASCDVHLCTHVCIWSLCCWYVCVKLSVCLCTCVCVGLCRCVLDVLYRAILFHVCCVCLVCVPGFLCAAVQGGLHSGPGSLSHQGPRRDSEGAGGGPSGSDTRRIKGWRSGWCVVCVCRCACVGVL